MVDDVTVGEVIDVERVGWHAKITMRIRKDVALPDNADRRDPPGQPAGREVRRPRAPDGGAGTGPARRRRQHPALRDRPQPRGRGGARRAVVPAQRRGRGPARHHHPGAQRGDERARGDLRRLLRSLTDVVGTLDDQKADIIRAMESINNLTATLNREKQTVTGALDVAGPAIKVLADQHDELVAMLSALDQLGRGRHQGHQQSKDDLLKSLAHLKPVLSELRAAGDKLAPGLNLILASRSPRRPRRSSAATTPTPRSGPTSTWRTSCRPAPPSRTSDPGHPAARPPAGGEVLSDVEKCLQSATSPAPRARRCWPTSTCSPAEEEVPEGQVPANPVCPVINTVPDVPLDELGDALGACGRGARGCSALGSPRTRADGRRPRGPSTEARHDPRHPDPARGVPRAQRGRDRLHHRQLPRLRRPGARPRASPCTRPCRPQAASTRAARSPTAASRSARSAR